MLNKTIIIYALNYILLSNVFATDLRWSNSTILSKNEFFISVIAACWTFFSCVIRLDLFSFFFFSKTNHIFEGLDMLENSWNFAHMPEVAKMYIWYGFQKWVWQNGSIAPPIKFQRSVPRAMVHIHVRNSLDTCNTPVPWYEVQNPTGSLLFECHFRRCA